LYVDQLEWFECKGSMANHLPNLLSYNLAPKSKLFPSPFTSESLSLPLKVKR
jgi:hypothetical protein